MRCNKFIKTHQNSSSDDVYRYLLVSREALLVDTFDLVVYHTCSVATIMVYDVSFIIRVTAHDFAIGTMNLKKRNKEKGKKKTKRERERK